MKVTQPARCASLARLWIFTIFLGGGATWLVRILKEADTGKALRLRRSLVSQVNCLRSVRIGLLQKADR